MGGNAMEGMKIMKSMDKKFNFILLIVVISSCMFAINSYGGKRMEPTYLYEYELENARELKPLKYTLDRSTSLSLFPVPQDNSVGTNDMNNAITLISFHKGGFLSSHKERISFDKFFKNTVDRLGGGGVYLPIVSKDVIAFGQVRRFMIYDFNKKIHRKFRIAESIAETIEKAAIADARQRRFIFEIEAHNSRSKDPWDISSKLLLMDLSGQEARLVKELNIGSGVIWTVVGDKNFLFDLETKQVKVLNMNLESGHHPLADVIKHIKGKVDFSRIHAHPFINFAVLYGGELGSTLVSWSKGKDKTPQPLLSSIDFCSFSPDGKWVVIKEDRSLDHARTYLMPVSEKYPHYLGSPILLLNDYFNDINFAWTTNPISFVGSIRNEIYRWDLENRDFPGKGKISFHDYIVQEDLKKLAREKRQGLGK
jgi:hypothetical protein